MTLFILRSVCCNHHASISTDCWCDGMTLWWIVFCLKRDISHWLQGWTAVSQLCCCVYDFSSNRTYCYNLFATGPTGGDWELIICFTNAVSLIFDRLNSTIIHPIEIIFLDQFSCLFKNVFRINKCFCRLFWSNNPWYLFIIGGLNGLQSLLVESSVYCKLRKPMQEDKKLVNKKTSYQLTTCVPQILSPTTWRNTLQVAQSKTNMDDCRVLTLLMPNTK